MKMTWKNKQREKTSKRRFDLPFDHADDSITPTGSELPLFSRDLESQGNQFAEEGRYREALGKWETAISLTPERAVLHEQKAQVLLELGETWNALKAATRATELESGWAEAWITLGRSQLNFGEPDFAVQSFDRALAIKPDSGEARDDKQAALNLVKRRKQLHHSDQGRFLVEDYKV
ncbi:hypothetical protein M569_10942 [Genlisea aurea]|uniref:Uncharacterized protein n=1 Tax=Genlisea aurea TaxID=192259 RepID=S8CH48_9LAMI|nr:hypothetical protein M569_10942 [Genlisea aurea]